MRLDHVALQVKDLRVAADFYHRVLDLEPVHQWSTTWMVGHGAIRLGLFQRPAATPVDDFEQRQVIQHFAILTTLAGLDVFKTRLETLGLKFEEDDSGIAKSIFITDPDGISVEVTAYYAKVPPGVETVDASSSL
jgi:catechol-2,3-dioxygenase